MIKRFTFGLVKRNLFNNNIKHYFSSKDPLEERKKSIENQYFTKKEAQQIKKLHNKLIKEGYNSDPTDDDVDVDDLLEDRDNIKKILVENGISNNEELIKVLLKWKYKRNNENNN